MILRSMATILHSPRPTRDQTPAPAAAETNALQTVLAELQQLREERQQERQERQRMQAEMHQMEQRLTQLSAPQIIPERSVDASVGGGGMAPLVSLGFKLKPDVFDGMILLRKFFTQFSLIARANGWDESAKAVALASCLKGKARS
ncbi:hypothetical protein DMN91_009249 [Ooceraea biroi]|uniref:Uncharacterized protein n=1 Tax=Ooceraea biroi TaxID=2015173 RepID=A0A3L8DEZ1_OOCBI|nr:hypothetical protein DMN91_009249 [Ooceraea biroi]